MRLLGDPQKGGLERRYNFIQILRDMGWPVLPLDLGDIAQKEAPVEQLPNIQQIIKYRYAMLSLKAMDCPAVGLGPIEAGNLFPIYGEWALQGDKPITLAANLQKRAANYPGIEDWVETTPKGSKVKVGVTSIFGDSLKAGRNAKDPVQFDSGSDALKALQAKAKNVDVRVLLYEGYTDRGKGGKPEAVACAEAFPEYQLMVALSDTDEPPANPLMANDKKTMIVTLGHKSKYIGVVGVYKTFDKTRPYDFRYQLVELGEEYLTPQKQETEQPILKLMEQYSEELKKRNYLAKYGQRKHPLQAAFPGKVKPSTFAPGHSKPDCVQGMSRGSVQDLA